MWLLFYGTNLYVIFVFKKLKNKIKNLQLDQIVASTVLTLLLSRYYIKKIETFWWFI